MNNGLSATANTSANLLDEKYSVNTLICVNSAKHGYSEIPLDKHMVLYGENNMGKTVTLNMMKLALFPDTSFKKCESKFAFRSKDGAYHGTAASHAYYFPSDQSYIIVEGENPHGVYCMVMFRTKDFGYGRVFVAATFAQIRYLFWQDDDGKFADDLKFSTILAGLKKFKHKQITDDNELAQIMFAGYRSSDDLARRFCVFPFSGDVTNETITAFRRVYQLAFDTNDNKETTLPMALATLIEMKRGRPQERLDANLIAMAEEHEKLLLRGEELQILENSKSQWLEVERVHSSLIEAHQTYSKRYHAMYHGAAAQLAEVNTMHAESVAQYNTKKDALNALKARWKETDNHVKVHSGELKRAQRDLQILDDKLVKAKAIHAGYGSLSTTEIVDILNDTEAELREKLASYQDQEKLQSRFTAITRRKQSNSERLGKLNAQLTGTQQTLAAQLSPHAQTIVHSLNETLTHAPLQLSDDAIAGFEQFTALFDAHENGLLMLQAQMLYGLRVKPFNAVEQRARIEREVIDLTNKVDDDSHELTEIKASLSGQNAQQQLEKIRQELAATEADLRLIQGLSTFAHELPEKQHQVTELEAEHALLQAKALELAVQMEPLEYEYNELTRQISCIEADLKVLTTANTRLERIRQHCSPASANPQLFDSVTISEQSLDELDELAKSIHHQLTAFHTEFERLVMAVKHPDIELFVSRTSLADYSEDMQRLNKVFTALDYDFNQHKQNIRTHNEIVNSQLRELRDAEEQIRNMAAAINQDLNSKQISNLSEVALDIKLRSSFMSLLEKLDKHNIEDDSLAERSFYEEILAFANKHINKQSRRIKLADIIERVDYSYRLAGSDKRVTEGQSGGTTSAVTAFVLSILLKQIVSLNYSMRLPIVVDEIGTLDSKNTKSVVNQIIDHGFTLFCATPNFSPSLNRIVGRTLTLDAVKVPEVCVEECSIHILPRHINYFGTHHEA